MAGVTVPVFQPDDTRHRRQIANWALEVNQGHLVNTGTVTLTPGATSTDVVDSRLAIDSWVGFMPLTAKALSAQPTVFVSTQAKGALTITHSATAATSKTFRYSILG